MGLSFITQFGVILILLGVFLPIYTANLFKVSKSAQEQYQEKIAQGDKGWLIDYRLSLWIHRCWIYIVLIGLVLFVLGFYI